MEGSRPSPLESGRGRAALLGWVTPERLSALDASFLAVALSFAAAPPAEAPSFARDVRPFVEKHCLGCHGPRKQSSGIRIDLAEPYRAEEGPLWTKVHEALAGGTMPPDDRPRPDRAEVGRVL